MKVSTNVFGLVTAILIAPLFATAQDADENAPGVDLNKVAAAELAAGIPEDLKDPGFASFVSSEDIRDAFDNLEGDLLADYSLALGQGEKVLMRNHRSGLTADGLMGVAAKVAVEMGDKATLERLAKAAAAGGNDSLASTFTAAIQTVAPARSSIDLGRYSYIDFGIRDAKIRADGDLLRSIADDLPEELSAAQRSHVARLIDEARPTSQADPNDTMVILKQLGEYSRTKNICRGAMLRPRVGSCTTINGTTEVSKSTGLANMIFSLKKPTVGNITYKLVPSENPYPGTISAVVGTPSPNEGTITKCIRSKLFSLPIKSTAPIGRDFYVIVYLYAPGSPNYYQSFVSPPIECRP